MTTAISLHMGALKGPACDPAVSIDGYRKVRCRWSFHCIFEAFNVKSFSACSISWSVIRWCKFKQGDDLFFFFFSLWVVVVTEVAGTAVHYFPLVEGIQSCGKLIPGP